MSNLRILSTGKQTPAPDNAAELTLPDDFRLAHAGEIVLVTVPVVYWGDRTQIALQLVPMLVSAGNSEGAASGCLFPQPRTEIKLNTLQAIMQQDVDRKLYLETVLFPAGVMYSCSYSDIGTPGTWQRASELPDDWQITGYRPKVGPPAQVDAEILAIIAQQASDKEIKL